MFYFRNDKIEMNNAPITVEKHIIVIKPIIFPELVKFPFEEQRK